MTDRWVDSLMMENWYLQPVSLFNALGKILGCHALTPTHALSDFMNRFSLLTDWKNVLFFTDFSKLLPDLLNFHLRLCKVVRHISPPLIIILVVYFFPFIQESNLKHRSVKTWLLQTWPEFICNSACFLFAFAEQAKDTDGWRTATL